MPTREEHDIIFCRSWIFECLKQFINICDGFIDFESSLLQSKFWSKKTIPETITSMRDRKLENRIELNRTGSSRESDFLIRLDTDTARPGNPEKSVDDEDDENRNNFDSE